MFTGFSENTMIYLNNLKNNNNKTWFEDNKADYEKYLLNVFKELTEALIPHMLEIDSFIDIRLNKCISRIYNDVRFSKDKSPYKSNMWISLKREYKDWKQEPTYYFELFPDGYRFGMGFHDIQKDTLEKIRKMIENEDEEFKEIYSFYNNQKLFRLEGNSYKRTLNDSIEEKYKEWYQKKEIYFVCDKSIDEVLFSRDLVDELAQGFKSLSPIYEFFLRLRER
ncbi:MAG: hypothetical protein K0S39_4954 [Paenibacillus sp.]|jgi:uncharacterized protein (TIGR02453 family)|nr:hypothetical protein [Paenibacillus sp.]